MKHFQQWCMAFLATPWSMLEACTASKTSCAHFSLFLPLSFLLPRIFPRIQPRWHLHDVICGDRQGHNKLECMAESDTESPEGPLTKDGLWEGAPGATYFARGLEGQARLSKVKLEGGENETSWRTPNATEGVGVKFYRQQGTTAVLWGFSHVGVSTEYSKDSLAFGGSQFIISGKWGMEKKVVSSNFLSSISQYLCFQKRLTFFPHKKHMICKNFSWHRKIKSRVHHLTAVNILITVSLDFFLLRSIQYLLPTSFVMGAPCRYNQHYCWKFSGLRFSLFRFFPVFTLINSVSINNLLYSICTNPIISLV